MNEYQDQIFVFVQGLLMNKFLGRGVRRTPRVTYTVTIILTKWKAL